MGAREMMHVWFTDELQTAFAIHAPVEALTESLGVEVKRARTFATGS